MFSGKDRVLFILLVSFAYSTLTYAEMPSPWDNPPADPGKVPVESKLVAKFATGNNERDGSCPALPRVSENLKTEGIYSRQKGHSTSELDKKKQSAYGKIIRPYREAALEITTLADRYRETGQSQYAVCATQLLNKMADGNILNGRIEGFQSFLTQSWMLSAYSVAWLKIREDTSVSAEDSSNIKNWLTQVAEKNKDYFDRRSKKHKDSNVVYWGGLAATAVGIASDRKDLYSWGIERYKSGLDSLQEDGTLPTEMIRGKRALYYHIFATIPLVGIAELAEANGDNLYAYRNHAIDKLVRQIVSSLQGESDLLRKVNQKQTAIGSNIYLGWLRVYNARFPVPGAEALLEKYTRNTYVAWGGQAPPIHK